MMHLETVQIVLLVAAGLIVGFSKTGVPGTGILMVPLMAWALGGRLSLGATVPMLVVGDCCAVAIYRAHADWDHVKRLTPWVLLGLVFGTVFLLFVPHGVKRKDPLNLIIGSLVLAMLGVQLLRKRLGDRLLPTSSGGAAATGVLAGFSTMASNAAGPIMSIYLTAAGLPKNIFMGTSAWYFFIFNLAKLPFLFLVTRADPAHPLFSASTLWIDLGLLPVILFGALLGRWLLPLIPEKAFSNCVLVLAAVAAVVLVFK